MGLDCSAYRQIKRVEPQPEFEDTPDDMVNLFVNPDFPGRADEIKDGLYTYAEEFDFAAGSYSGYNTWREQLAKLAAYPAVRHESRGCEVRRLHSAGAWAATGGPFWELIHFADNEGTIGAAVAAKLAKDFADFQSKADAFEEADHDGWFRAKYAEWRKAFEMAADGGAVDFG